MNRLSIFFWTLILISITSIAQTNQFVFQNKLSTWGIIDRINIDMNSISFSNDEKYLAAAGAQGSLIIWNLETGQIQRDLTDTTKDNLFFIRSCKYSPNGNFLATVGASVFLKTKSVIKDNQDVIETEGKAIERKVIRIYETQNYNLVKEISYDSIAEILSCIFTPTSEYLIIGESLGIIRIFECKNWKEKMSVKTNEDHWDIAINSKGDKVYTGTSEGQVIIWKFLDGKLDSLSMLKLTNTEISSISISPDDHSISVNQDSLRIYNLLLPQNSTLINITTYGSYSCSFSKDSEYIASGNEKNRCEIWDAKTLRLIQTLQGDLNNFSQNDSGENYTRPIFSSNSSYVAMTNNGGMIYIYKRQ